MLLDVFSKGVRGKEAEAALGKAHMTVNRNAIPFDTNPPLNPSGIRVGTPAVTTRGMKETEMRRIGAWIAETLRAPQDETRIAKIRGEVLEMAAQFPLYRWRLAAAYTLREPNEVPVD